MKVLNLNLGYIHDGGYFFSSGLCYLDPSDSYFSSAFCWFCNEGSNISGLRLLLKLNK